MKTLNQTDLSRLADFLNSPFHNKKKIIIRFYKALMLFYPTFSEEALSAEYIYAQLYPDKGYNEKTIKNMMSLLKKSIESYFVYEELDKNKEMKMELLYKAHSKRHNGKAFIRESGKLDKHLDQYKNKTKEYYLKKMQINFDVYEHFGAKANKEEARNFMLNSMENLDRFFLMSKLEYSFRLLNAGAVLGLDYRIRFFEESIDLGETILQEENILYKLYCLIISLLDEGTNASFLNLKNLIIDNFPLFDPQHQTDTIALLNNYITNESRKGSNSYMQESLDLAKLRESNKLLISNDQISSTVFCNLVITAAGCKDFAWVDYFVRSYAKYLNKNEKGDCLNLSNAYICFAQQEFAASNAYLNLSTLNNKKVIFELRYRALQIKCLIELQQLDKGEGTFLKSCIEQLKGYLVRRKGRGLRNNITILSYKNFCAICLMIDRRSRKKNILNRVNSMEFLMHKEWLIEKINHLKN